MLQRQICATLLAIGLAMSASIANALPITLSAVQDTTIVERPTAGQSTNNNGTLLQVWNNGSGNGTSGRRREAFFQFDLTSVGPGYNIVSAHLEYYDTGLGDYNGSQASAFRNDTYVLRLIGTGTDDDKKVVNGVGGPVAFDKNGMYEANVTYNTYNSTTVATPKLSLRTNNAEWSYDAGPLSSLDLILDPDNAAGYHSTGSADAAALQILNEENLSHGYIIFLSYWNSTTNTTGRTFGDHESGNPVKLVLNVEPVPEPSALILANFGGIGLVAYCLRKWKKQQA